jgi:hypothetical protein
VVYDRGGHDWGWGPWLGMTLLTVVVVAAVALVVRALIAAQQPSRVPRGAGGQRRATSPGRAAGPR